MSSTADWTQTFFSGFIVDAQRLFPQQTAAEADFLQQGLALKPGDRVLDVPCGAGRLANELAGRGFTATGVDGCTDLLDDARREASERGLKSEFQRRDMRDLPWTGHFDAAFCFGNSFSYFDDDQNLRFLKAVRGALKPGGRFALETHFVAETVFTQLQSKRWFPFGDLILLHDTSYDPPSGTITSTYRIIRGGKMEEKQAVYRVYTYREVLRLVESAGFGVLESYGSLTREPLRIGSPGLWLIARRPA
jgi:SAM-dependent methyltransferase